MVSDRRLLIVPAGWAILGVLVGIGLHQFDIQWRESHDYGPLDRDLNIGIWACYVWVIALIAVGFVVPKAASLTFLAAFVPLLGLVLYLVVAHLYVSPQIFPLLMLIWAAIHAGD